MKVFLKKQVNVCWEVKTNKFCCDKMKITLRDSDLILDCDNNKTAYGRIKHWNPSAGVLCGIEYCPWCGEKIEMVSVA